MMRMRSTTSSTYSMVSREVPGLSTTPALAPRSLICTVHLIQDCMQSPNLQAFPKPFPRTNLPFSVRPIDLLLCSTPDEFHVFSLMLPEVNQHFSSSKLHIDDTAPTPPLTSRSAFQHHHARTFSQTLGQQDLWASNTLSACAITACKCRASSNHASRFCMTLC